MSRPHHWLHPQTVPRGFLRIYILNLLSIGPQTGYSIIQRIDERTEGAWKPGAGTMYPLLKSLSREGLVKAPGRARRGVSKTYSLTPKGRGELEEVRKVITGAGRKEPVMSRLFSDILPGSVLVPVMVRRFRDGADMLKQKAAEIPAEERPPILKELRAVLEAQIDWIDSQLGGDSKGGASQTAEARSRP
jgi:DNA-binding PadR family transcriptional regulator